MKIGILISGRGSNMAAIADAVRSGEIPGAEVTVVVSDKRNAEGLQKAADRGIEAIAVTRAGRSREEHDRAIIEELQSRGVEMVCLAGYMRLLSTEFVSAFPQRVINIHPSLLPSFKGLDAQRQAFEYGVRITGCTVHFVDEELDHGAIIAQRSVQVDDDDTAATVAAKVLAQEHALYVYALRRLIIEGYRIEGRRVIFGS